MAFSRISDSTGFSGEDLSTFGGEGSGVVCLGGMTGPDWLEEGREDLDWPFSRGGECFLPFSVL